MDTNIASVPFCTLKCLRNVEHVSNSVHSLKYGVNTIGRCLNNDIVLKNSNVSRTHCHLRVEKKESKDIAFIKDMGTSNGTIVGNINLIEFEEYQLNDLDMIVLASGDEGVVLQYINQIDHHIVASNLSNDQISNKRKVFSTENVDEPTITKIPKLVVTEPGIKDLFPIESLSNKLKQIPNTANILKCTDQNQSTSNDVICESVKDSDCQMLQIEKLSTIPSNDAEPSCSYKDNLISSSKIKLEPETVNNIFSQGTYRNEGDSVIVIYSSDEENDVNENDLKSSEIEIEQTKSNISLSNSYPSTSKEKNNLNPSNWSIQRNEIASDDEDDMMPFMSNTNISNNLMNSSDSDSDCINKYPKIIEPIPLKSNKKKDQTKVLEENKYIMKTRAKSEKKMNSKKKAEEITVDKNKQIVLERRLKLQQLSNNKNASLNEVKMDPSPFTYDTDIDKPSTTDRLKKRTRISRLQQNNIDNCMPSTSKSHITMDVKQNGTLLTRTNVKLNSPEISSKIKTTPQSPLNCNNMDSSANKIINLVNYAYFDTLSRICKWNAVWLMEEKFVDRPPPLVKTISKMKIRFENPYEYSSIVTSLLLHEIWSKLSELYNTILQKNPTLEKCIFEKSIMRDISLLSFNIQSVNKDFSTSVQELKSISEPLWCLKCIETNNKNINTKAGPRFSLKGYLCIVIIQSKSFETDNFNVKKPTKSKNIFFAYVNVAKKIGLHSNSQLYLELIVTRKTEIIPNGTLIHLMDICYLHSELRLFQAIYYMTNSSLKNAFIITSQLHNYSIDSSKVTLKNYNTNRLTLNNSQKEAVKMAVSICSTKKPNVGVIIGPPGTGKTNVICNIIINLMSNLQTKPKLLICAPSNEAVDAIVKRVLEIKKDIKHELQFNVVRVGGQKYDSHSPIVDVMLDTLVSRRMNNSNEENQQGSSNIYYNKKDLEIDILRNTDVVMTTLNSCFSKKMEEAFMPLTLKSLNNCHFAACIVDEAGQCMEPLNFVPLLLGIEKLILVGDDKQLQPIIKSKPAKENGLGISLFKRLKTWFEHKRFIQRSFPIATLDIQYRMHNEICLFPSKYFYKGKIKTAPSVKARDQLSLQPYLILEHESQQDNSGEVNIGEANMIVNLVDILLKSECRSLNIAVLTPYTKQKEQINTLLETKKISLNVNTIDSFQGSECDVLLMSTVRTNGVGFMDDMCRLNVALTRAKQSLIICGNFMSLKGERVWCDLLEDAKKRKLIKKVSKRVITNPKSLYAMIKY